MGKLYAVTEGRYSDYHIVALSSDKEKAEELAKWYNLREHTNAEVEEFEDSVSVPTESINSYSVVFDCKGRIIQTNKCWVDYGLQKYVYCNPRGFLEVSVLAENVEAAEKIASERRAQWLAEHTGEV